MTAAGLWTVVLALAYTAWLVVGGRIMVRRKETGRASDATPASSARIP